MQTAISTYGRVELNELPPKVPDVAAAEVLVLEAEFNPVDLRRLPLDRPQPDLLPRRERKGLGHCAQHREAQRSPELLGLLLGDAQHQVHADMLSCSRGGGSGGDLHEVAGFQPELGQKLRAEQQLLLAELRLVHKQGVLVLGRLFARLG